MRDVTEQLDRYADALERTLLATRPATLASDNAAPRGPRRSRRTVAVVACVVVAVLGVVGVASLTSDDGPLVVTAQGTLPTTSMSGSGSRGTTSTSRAQQPSLLATIPVIGGRMPVLVTSDSVWVAGERPDVTGSTVQRVDPGTDRVNGEVRRTGPTMVLTEAFGSIWACGTSLDRIDPITMAIVASYPQGCSFGMADGFGSLWLTGSKRVVRLAPDGTVEARIEVPGGEWGIAVGAGSVWVADGSTVLDGTVARIDPTTNTVRATIAVPVRTRNIVANDDAVWLTAGADRDNTVSLIRIDPRSDTIVATIGAPAEATGIALASGFVWAIGNGGDVAVVDSRTNAVVFHDRLVPPDAQLGGDRLAIGFGSAWLGVQTPGGLARYDLGALR